METNNQNKEILKNIYKAFDTGNTSDLHRYVSPSAVDHNPDFNEAPSKGPEMVKNYIEEYRRGFPDLKLQVNYIVSEGDHAIAHLTMTGTHKGEFMGLHPSSKKIKVEGYDHVRIKNGKIEERWGVFDMLTFMNQLGVLPDTAKIIEKAKMKEAVL